MKHTVRTRDDGVVEITARAPGYDHLYGPNARPGGGIHGETIFHVVKTRIPTPGIKRSVALAMEITTNRYPNTVPLAAQRGPRDGYWPRLNTLSVHVETAAPERACDWVGYCETIWDTSLVRDHFDACEKDCDKPGWDAWPTAAWGDVDEPNELFWISMLAKLAVFTTDPTRFAQPDEPAILRAAREALAHAKELVASGAKLIAEREARVAALIADYNKTRTL